MIKRYTEIDKLIKDIKKGIVKENEVVFLNERPCVNVFEEGKIKKKKGLSLKPYFQRGIISEEEIKKAKENSERTRRSIFR